MKIITGGKMDRGLAYAEACFETFRVIDGHIFDWPGHWRRLVLGLSEFGLSLSPGQNEEILFACLREATGVGEDALIRLTISGGESAWGLCRKADEPVVHIQAVSYEAGSSPQFLRLMSWPFALQKKTAKFVADYAHTLRALHGATDACVLFEQDGMLLATATANILLYRGGGWHTPPAYAGVLPGRVRDFLIRHGLVQETSCSVMWLRDCEAVAVCNSGLFIQPVAWIEGVERVEPVHVQHEGLQILTDALAAAEGVRL
ncbi:MAG: aminotransferase class IV [Mariprofundus sp.]